MNGPPGPSSRPPSERPRAPGRDDYYARHVSSDAYRAERAAKARVIAELCRDALRRATWIADVGAGTGLIKARLEAEFDKPIVGFDVDEAFVVERHRMVVADACRLPVADDRFDLLLLNHVYEHARDQAGLFREAWRVLRPGGTVYVSAGNRLAVVEPHYRLPFLSWLPRALADRYLRLSGRGTAYEGVRFLTYRPLRRLMSAPGFRVRDITERALHDLLGGGRGARWRPAWRALRALPRGPRARLLQTASPQWFFLLDKPRQVTGGADVTAPGGESA